MRDEQISLTSTSYILLPNESATFSGQSARWWGVMEADDYVKFLYVIDGVETEFSSRNGTISTGLSTAEATYTNNTGSPQSIELRVKVKNSWNEGHYVDNFKISKVLAPPVYKFYSDASLTTLVGTGNNYDPMTVPGTTTNLWVTCTENGCESIADPVSVTVSPNNVTPMAGEAAFYCAGGNTIDFTQHISNYQPGGTWTDDDTSGISLLTPTAVDASSLANGSYNFTYTLNGVAPCNGEMAVITLSVGELPEPPTIEDVTVCAGGSTVIAVEDPDDVQEELYNQPFNGSNGNYILLSRCSGILSSTCRVNDLNDMSNRGLTIEDSTDFSKFTTWSTHVYDVNQVHFAHLMDEQIVLITDSFTLLDGEVANFSGDSRRYYGTLEAGDYVKFFYVIDGVETEFDSREGNISTVYSKSIGFYNNTTGGPVNVQLRVKVKNSYAEGHMIDNLKITKTLNKPTYNFYSDVALTTLVATGYTYDPATPANTTETYYVTTLSNGCESIADEVVVTVDTSDLTPMDGAELFYCGGTSTDLTALITPFQAGGVFADIDGAGVNLSDSTAVDFSAVGSGSYNFSYKVSGSCGFEETIITIHIGILGGEPYVISDGAVATALTECIEGNWIYFIDPNDDNRRIAAINTNGNNISPSAFSVTVDVDAPTTDLERASGTGTSGKAVELIRRQVQINCPTCGNLSPAVDVRLYWESTEKIVAGVKMDLLMATNFISGSKYWEWFKVSHDISDIPANFDSDGIADVSGTAQAWSVPSSSGSESNGVEYVQFDGITDFSTFGGGWFVNQPDGTILPVELVKLEAKPIDNKYIEINWETATEINNDGFELLRSSDGESFEKIAWIEGAGNSTNNLTYQYDDFEVVSNTYYYRLNQIDFDGNATLSPIVNATLKTLNKDLFNLKLSPNPTQNKSQLEIITNKAQNVSVKVYDVLGRIVYTESLILKEGTNSSTIESGNITPGMYSVLITKDDKILDTIKWIVNSK